MSPPADPDSAPPAAPVPSPAAIRSARSRWRDPRLVVGIAVLALSVLLGARLLDAADDTVGVWVARDTLTEGQPLGAATVVRREIRFAGQRDADRYLSADEPLPEGALLDRAVGAGELVPRAAVGGAALGALTEVPLSVAAEAVPATVRVGSVVDVWVTPEAVVGGAGSAGGAVGDLDGPDAPRSVLVFDDVDVLAAPATSSSLGPSATRQVIVGIDRDREDRLPASIAALSQGTLVLTVRR